LAIAGDSSHTAPTRPNVASPGPGRKSGSVLSTSPPGAEREACAAWKGGRLPDGRGPSGRSGESDPKVAMKARRPGCRVPMARFVRGKTLKGRRRPCFISSLARASLGAGHLGRYVTATPWNAGRHGRAPWQVSSTSGPPGVRGRFHGVRVSSAQTNNVHQGRNVTLRHTIPSIFPVWALRHEQGRAAAEEKAGRPAGQGMQAEGRRTAPSATSPTDTGGAAYMSARPSRGGGGLRRRPGSRIAQGRHSTSGGTAGFFLRRPVNGYWFTNISDAVGRLCSRGHEQNLGESIGRQAIDRRLFLRKPKRASSASAGAAEAALMGYRDPIVGGSDRDPWASRRLEMCSREAPRGHCPTVDPVYTGYG